MSASHRLRVYLVQNGAAASFAAESSPLNRRGDDPAYLNGLSIVEIDAEVRSDEFDELVDWAAEACRISPPWPRDIADKTLCALVGQGCNLRVISFGREPAYWDYIRKVRKHLKINAVYARDAIDKAVSVMESWLALASELDARGEVYLAIARDAD